MRRGLGQNTRNIKITILRAIAVGMRNWFTTLSSAKYLYMEITSEQRAILLESQIVNSASPSPGAVVPLMQRKADDSPFPSVPASDNWQRIENVLWPICGCKPTCLSSLLPGYLPRAGVQENVIHTRGHRDTHMLWNEPTCDNTFNSDRRQFISGMGPSLPFSETAYSKSKKQSSLMITMSWRSGKSQQYLL